MFAIIWIEIFLFIFLFGINLYSCHNFIRHRTLNYALESYFRKMKGNGASLYEYTFMAVLVKYDTLTRGDSGDEGKLHCGGAIIHKDWILTAARCFDKDTSLQQYEIYAGIVDLSDEDGQQIRLIKNIVIHPNYNKSTDEFNIAMIQVSSSFFITTHVSAGFLPAEPYNITETERCHLLGFVREYTDDEGYRDRLMKVQMHAINYNECLERLKVLNSTNPYNLSNKNFCLVQIEEFPNNNSQGACEGDVGGPCICSYKIQGLIANYTYNTCFKVGYPTTIVDVGQHLDWIRKNILQLKIPQKSSTNWLKNTKYLLQLLYLLILLADRLLT